MSTALDASKPSAPHHSHSVSTPHVQVSTIIPLDTDDSASQSRGTSTSTLHHSTASVSSIASSPGHLGSPTASSRPGSPSSARGRSSRKMKRPPMPSRMSSGTMIIPRDRSSAGNSDAAPEEYPPDDARAMSPRRGSEETEAMEQATKASLREKARQAQLNLLEIAESIELVKANHDALQRQNAMLQDYIGGLTRSMSKTDKKGGKKGGK